MIKDLLKSEKLIVAAGVLAVIVVELVVESLSERKDS